MYQNLEVNYPIPWNFEQISGKFLKIFFGAYMTYNVNHFCVSLYLVVPFLIEFVKLHFSTKAHNFCNACLNFHLHLFWDVALLLFA